jgi:hypothetical protein
MLINKSANILAFDEIIGKDTSFEGNYASNAIDELKIIISFLISKQCYTDNITETELTQLLTIVSKTKSNIDIDDIDIDKDTENYYLVGWPGHVILLFYEKISEDLYDVGLINAGEGVDIHGIFNDSGNCIIIFKDISKEKLHKFLDNYIKFFKNTPNRGKIDKKYYSFYSLLLNNLVDEKTYDVDFLKVITKKNILTLKMNIQHIGSCGFTNHIYYLSYLIYKKDSNSDYNTIYLKWYSKAKDMMKQINSLADPVLAVLRTSALCSTLKQVKLLRPQ